jgi:NADH dehydrogenase FAD-containing subunit
VQWKNRTVWVQPEVKGEEVVYRTDDGQDLTTIVWQDSEVLAHNVHAMMQSEPAKLRAPKPGRLQFLYAGASHALLSWGGRCMQGRAVAWLKQFLKS